MTCSGCQRNRKRDGTRMKTWGGGIVPKKKGEQGKKTEPAENPERLPCIPFALNPTRSLPSLVSPAVSINASTHAQLPNSPSSKLAFPIQPFQDEVPDTASSANHGPPPVTCIPDHPFTLYSERHHVFSRSDISFPDASRLPSVSALYCQYSSNRCSAYEA